MPQPAGFLKFMLDVFYMISVQGREPYLGNYIEYSFNFVLCFDAYEPISFKLGMMIDMTSLYCLIPVWIILTLIQGHWLMRKVEHMQLFC